MSRVLFLEINEVPYRLIDKYAGSGHFPSIHEFFSRATQYESIAVDKGELSPWVTWPTVHRGMSADSHKIFNLGQDVSTFCGTPIWEDLVKAGKVVGVFGSLQSWPPKNPGKNGFYVPDTFAQDASCWPQKVEPLQVFNLQQVKKNGREVSAEVPSIKEFLAFGISALRCGVSFGTCFKLVKQLVGERLNPNIRARRPCFQTLIFWDVFKHLYFSKIDQIDYASFFTNHIAGVMHRYWDHIFPEDFGKCAPQPHEQTLLFALKILDDMLKDVLRLQKEHPDLVIVFGSSMGQGPVYRKNHKGFELSVVDLSKLMMGLGVRLDQFEPLLAMAPQCALKVEVPELRSSILRSLEGARFRCGSKAFEVKEIERSLSITVQCPEGSDIGNETIVIEGREFRLDDLGVKVHWVEPGTGYHIPEGIYATLESGFLGDKGQRVQIKADKIKQHLLSLVSGANVS